MSLYTSARVGPRQWAILLAAEDAYPHAIVARAAAKAVIDGLPFSAQKPILEGLIGKGLLNHNLDCGEHPLTPGCWLVITDRGAWARRSRR